MSTRKKKTSFAEEKLVLNKNSLRKKVVQHHLSSLIFELMTNNSKSNFDHESFVKPEFI